MSGTFEENPSQIPPKSAADHIQMACDGIKLAVEQLVASAKVQPATTPTTMGDDDGHEHSPSSHNGFVPSPSTQHICDIEAVNTLKESRRNFFLQVCLPFVLAGGGMVCAGILLDRASSWTFLSKMPEALILVPALLGLKGNLEMNLASRMSTAANLGRLDTARQQIVAFYSNLAIDQAQAIIVAMVAAFLAIGVNAAGGIPFEFSRALCLVLSATISGSVTSIVLASMMIFLTIGARRCGLNPDNIATPVAAATGDCTSLASLVFFGTWFYRFRDSHMPLQLLFLLLLLGSTLCWMWVASRMPMTRAVLKYGWFAVLAAMVISSAGGFVLRNVINLFPGIALFQPLINGVGGNLVAVQASKISTYLHRNGKAGLLPLNRLLTYANPLRTFRCKERESHHALILFAMGLPGHFLFMGMLMLTGQMGPQSLNFSFLVLFLCAAMLQIALLLYCCQLLCRVLWLLRWDPDTNSIPLLTALGDFLGTSLLAVAFFVHSELFQETVGTSTMATIELLKTTANSTALA